MPASGAALTQPQVDLIQAWIAAGALNNLARERVDPARVPQEALKGVDEPRRSDARRRGLEARPEFAGVTRVMAPLRARSIRSDLAAASSPVTKATGPTRSAVPEGPAPIDDA